MPRPMYVHANELMSDVAEDVSPQKGDRILSVCGSLEQACVFLRHGAHVSVVDSDAVQLAYAKERFRALLQGDYSSFLMYASVRKVDLFNKAYFCQEGFLSELRSRLHALCFLPAGDILGQNSYSGFRKFYLSNIFDWDKGTIPHAEKVLQGFGERIPVGSLVALSFFPGDFSRVTSLLVQKEVPQGARAVLYKPE